MVSVKKDQQIRQMPISRGMYAWNAVHAGSFLLFVEGLTDCYKFIFLPGPSEYFLTFKDFEQAVERKILEFVEVLPEDVYQESLSLSCPAQTSTLNA